jgi:DNA repair protein RAD7
VREAIHSRELVFEFANQTAYTKPRPKGGHLCVPCCYALGIDPFAKAKAAKKAVKKPPAKEARTVKRFDDRQGALPLGDLCIQIIGKYIQDVEQLGDIGHINMDKVCKIICRGRLL